MNCNMLGESTSLEIECPFVNAIQIQVVVKNLTEMVCFLMLYRNREFVLEFYIHIYLFIYFRHPSNNTIMISPE